MASASVHAVERAAAVRQPARGHVLVHIRGTGRQLAIQEVFAKADECGPNRVASALHGYALVAIGADGAELGSVPLDLSAFDLERRDPGARVVGDQVWETEIALLAKLPHFAGADHLQIRQHGVEHSRFASAAYRRAVAALEENR